MRFMCVCGNVIRDTTDNLPYKANYTTDREWEVFYNAVDDYIRKTIEKSGDLIEVKKEALMNDDYPPQEIRSMYQCQECGRLHVEDKKFGLVSFKPEGRPVNKKMFE